MNTDWKVRVPYFVEIQKIWEECLLQSYVFFVIIEFSLHFYKKIYIFELCCMENFWNFPYVEQNESAVNKEILEVFTNSLP